MIDNIEFTANVTVQQATDLREKLLGNKDKCLTGFYSSIANMKVKYSPFKNVVVFSGSLAKYLNGNNIQDFNRHDVKKAINKLECETGLMLYGAELNRVEYGINATLTDNVNDVLLLFGSCPHYQRIEYTSIGNSNILESVYYDTNSGCYQFKIYDKKKESNIVLDKSLIRFEYCIKNTQGIKQLFNKSLKLHELENIDVWNKLTECFYNFYSSIKKTDRQLFINCDKAVTSKDFLSVLSLCCYKNNGEVVGSLLSDLLDKELMTEAEKKRVIKKLNELHNNYDVSNKGLLSRKIDSLILLKCKNKKVNSTIKDS